jgi:hypothetical protein
MDAVLERQVLAEWEGGIEIDQDGAVVIVEHDVGMLPVETSSSRR